MKTDFSLMTTGYLLIAIDFFVSGYFRYSKPTPMFGIHMGVSESLGC